MCFWVAGQVIHANKDHLEEPDCYLVWRGRWHHHFKMKPRKKLQAETLEQKGSDIFGFRLKSIIAIHWVSKTRIPRTTPGLQNTWHTLVTTTWRNLYESLCKRWCHQVPGPQTHTGNGQNRKITNSHKRKHTVDKNQNHKEQLKF